MRTALLRSYCWVTSYRFRTRITNRLVTFYPTLTTEVIRTKAGASLTSVSALLAFTVAVLPFIVPSEFRTIRQLLDSEQTSKQLYLCVILAVVLPYSSFWLERYISAAGVETADGEEQRKRRGRRSSLLIVSLAASLFLFLCAPECWPAQSHFFMLAFSLAGAIMVVLSIVFLLFSLEFYDSAAGWRGSVDLHFHLAMIASNSYVFGLSLVLMGASLAVSASHFIIGRVLAACTLLVLTVITEIERALWVLDKS